MAPASWLLFALGPWEALGMMDTSSLGSFSAKRARIMRVEPGGRLMQDEDGTSSGPDDAPAAPASMLEAELQEDESQSPVVPVATAYAGPYGGGGSFGGDDDDGFGAGAGFGGGGAGGYGGAGGAGGGRGGGGAGGFGGGGYGSGQRGAGGTGQWGWLNNVKNKGKGGNWDDGGVWKDIYKSNGSDWNVSFAGVPVVPATSYCGVAGLLIGGYKVAGQGAILTSNITGVLGFGPLLKKATYKVSFQFVKIDNWNGEKAFVKVNGKLCWNKTFSIDDTDNADLCGTDSMGDKMVSINCTVRLWNQTSINIEVWADLTLGPESQSFGITAPTLAVKTYSCKPDACPSVYGLALSPKKDQVFYSPLWEGSVGTIDACCVEMGQCKRSTLVCDYGQFKSTKPEFCQGPVCTPSECCKMRATCSPTVCVRAPGTKVAISPLPTQPCRTDVCLASECCTDVGTCTLDVCQISQGDAPRWNTAVKLYCKGSTCTPDDCCVKLPKCSGDFCKAGYELDPDKAKAYCKSLNKEACFKDCCRELPACKAADCKAPQQLKATGLPKFCNATPCTSTECCEAAAANSTNSTNSTDSTNGTNLTAAKSAAARSGLAAASRGLLGLLALLLSLPAVLLHGATA